MTYGCAVRGCDKPITPMRRIPHPVGDQHRRFEKWLAVLGNEQIRLMEPMKVYSLKRVCSRHFSPDCYVLGTNKLKRNAIPNLLLPDPEEAAQDPSMSPRPAENCDSNHELLPENEEIVSTVPQPITTNNISKHIADPCHMVKELPEVYTFVTLPHLEQFHLNVQWVYKILSGEEEQERIIYESPSKDDKDGFLLIKDSRWDGVNLDNLHLLAIAYRPGILSLRDLRQHHLSLLKNIYVMGKEVIMEKYDIVSSQLRIFIQYQPSFYHLHVHFTTINDGICEFHCGKAHLLDSVINNIQICPTYYEISPLTFCLKESDYLFEKFEAHGLVKRI